jgi:hypothetical protein
MAGTILIRSIGIAAKGGSIPPGVSASYTWTTYYRLPWCLLNREDSPITASLDSI